MTHTKQNLFLAVFVCAIACFFIAAAGACSKLISKQVSTFTILFFQNLLGLLLCLPQTINKGWSSLKTKRWGLHLSRDLIGLLIFFFLFSSLKRIPLVDGILLNNTAPLWIPLIAWVWLRIRVENHLWWGIIIGFVGIILILKPSAQAFSSGALLGLCSGICAGITILLIGKLSQTEPTHRTIFYYFLVGTIVSTPFAFFQFTIPIKIDLLYLVGVGLFVFLAQTLLTYSFQHAKASLLAPITYVVVIYSGIFDWLIWNHLPDLFTFMGIFLVILGAILAIHFERRYLSKKGVR
jgi:drug/metabolite transporter (DMT)-like permease